MKETSCSHFFSKKTKYDILTNLKNIAMPYLVRFIYCYVGYLVQMDIQPWKIIKS